MVYDEPLYTIREVSEITGVKPVTLRAWQRRYSLVQPQRTEKGHRLYLSSDIDTIRQIQSWLAKGVSIGKVKPLLLGQQSEDELDKASELAECAALLEALSTLHRNKAQQIISTVFKEYPLDLVETQFLNPVMNTLEHVKGSLRSLQKGLLQTLMLSTLVGIYEAENKVRHKHHCLCVSMDPVGNIHAWLWMLRLSERGLNVTFLDGVDDLSSLLANDMLTSYSHIGIFTNRSLTSVHYEQIRDIQANFSGKCCLSDVLTTLMT
ncbi:MerR family transcriptional regulator [Vibrio zhugei]|uniref:MerR family transcriptional regulator n=1 Tax=Vibrio zhugei TaxID=2479546 RepID=A0ABV7CCM2_9VIBR|nr:MerR family transcriptional regulator [Vibrio zhugei]